jgi:hypothetical protein
VQVVQSGAVFGVGCVQRQKHYKLSLMKKYVVWFDLYGRNVPHP